VEVDAFSTFCSEAWVVWALQFRVLLQDVFSTAVSRTLLMNCIWRRC
jgi:hypothetical protein